MSAEDENGEDTENVQAYERIRERALQGEEGGGGAHVLCSRGVAAWLRILPPPAHTGPSRAKAGGPPVVGFLPSQRQALVGLLAGMVYGAL